MKILAEKSTTRQGLIRAEFLPLNVLPPPPPPQSNNLTRLKVTSNHRGCPSEKNIRTRSVLKETPTNYISKKVYKMENSIKLCFVLDFAFQKRQRPSTPK